MRIQSSSCSQPATGDVVQQTAVISVIIPTFNRAGTLRAAIDSALAQTYPHTEVIVVDDGSTDETKSLLMQYDAKIRVARQANAGPAAARNTGARIANGDMLAFLDSDDVWMPRRLQLQVDAMTRAGTSIQCCVCDVELRGPQGRTLSAFERAGLRPCFISGIWLNPFEIVATRFLFFNQSVLIRRRAFDQVHGYDESLRLLEDTDLALRVALLGPWAFVAEPLVLWQQSADSLSCHVHSRKIFLKQSELGIRSRLWGEEGRQSLRASQKRIMDGEIRRNRRELQAAVWGDSRDPWKRSLGIVLKSLEYVRTALLRRSPWYPRMRVASFTQPEVQDKRFTEVG